MNDTTDKPITYVYDSKEVYLTGRVANPQKSAPRTLQGKNMVEIVPIGTAEGDKTFARWVKMDELFIIEDLDEQDFNEHET